MEAATDFARLVAARLCHDLGGGAAAVLTLLDLAADGDRAALAEAAEAARAQAARLRLLRAAWGRPEAMAPATVAALAAGLPNAERVAVDVAALPDELPEAMAQAVLNTVMLGAEGLRHGGTVRLAVDDRGDVVARLDGRDAAWPPGLAAALAEPDQPVGSPRALLPVLMTRLARDGGVRLSLLFGAGESVPMLLIGRPDAAT